MAQRRTSKRGPENVTIADSLLAMRSCRILAAMNFSESTESSSTSVSLLERVKAGDDDAWNRFARLYGPFIYAKCRKAGFGESDAADITQNSFAKVFGSIKNFRREDPNQQFRRWLATLVRTVIIDFARAKKRATQGQGGDDAHEMFQNQADIFDEDSFSTSENDRALLMRQAINLIKDDFEATTWQAFWKTTIENQTSKEVGQELGMEANAVRQAKLRVRRRLVEELAGLLDGLGFSF